MLTRFVSNHVTVQETSFSFTYDPNAKRLKPKLKIKSQDSWDIYRKSCHPITGLSVTSCDIMLHTAAKTTRHAARHRAVRAWAPDPVWTLPYWCAYYSTDDSTENYEHRCLTPLKSASSIYTVVNKQYHFMISSDRFPVPARSAVKSNFTNWCCQNLSKL